MLALQVRKELKDNADSLAKWDLQDQLARTAHLAKEDQKVIAVTEELLV